MSSLRSHRSPSRISSLPARRAAVSFQAHGQGGQGRQHDHLSAGAEVGLQLLLGRDAARVGQGVDIGVLERQGVNMDRHVLAAEELQPLADLLPLLLLRLVLAAQPDQRVAEVGKNGGHGQFLHLAVHGGDARAPGAAGEFFPEGGAENRLRH